MKDKKYGSNCAVLAERLVAYGWLMVAVTAASPLLDSSFVEKGKFDQDYFSVMASVQEVLAFETEKFVNCENRYAWRIRKALSDGYVQQGLELAKKRQEELNV